MSLSILYLGDDSPRSTSRHRADALTRLGCKVIIINTEKLIPKQFANPFIFYLHYKTGYNLLQRRLLHSLKAHLSSIELVPELVWVNAGELLGATILQWLRVHFQCPFILYQNDDPTGRRDGNRFLSLRTAIPFYDACFFVRPETELEALAMGAKRTLRVLMSYDEYIHSPPSNSPDGYDPVISFVGTFIRGECRDSFLNALVRAGLPITLTGNRWNRSSYWQSLKRFCNGPALAGAAYSQALASAAVTLGFLSHQNRDLITRRSVETPACGGLLCAERTSEHQLLYEDGHEAVFWDSPEECIQQCRELLHQPITNQRIRSTGHRHVRRLGVGNEDICRQILASI